MIRAGQLRHTLVIQQSAESKSERMATEYTFSTYITRRAAQLDVSGTQTFVGEQFVERQTRSYEVRFDSETAAVAELMATKVMRFVIDGKTFRVTAAFDPDGRRQRIQLTGLEEANP